MGILAVAARVGGARAREFDHDDMASGYDGPGVVVVVALAAVVVLVVDVENDEGEHGDEGLRERALAALFEPGRLVAVDRLLLAGMSLDLHYDAVHLPYYRERHCCSS